MIPGIKFMYTNGINNSLKFAIENAKTLSDMGGGLQITLVYNPDIGTLNNVTRYALSKNGYRLTRTAVALQKEFDKYFDSEPTGEIFVVGHSEGTTNLRNAEMGYDQERRMRINNILVAPSSYIEDKFCKSVVHYESKNRDIVPRLDRKGRFLSRETLVSLDPHKDAPLFDHGFQSPTFQGVLYTKIRNATEAGGGDYAEN